MDSPLWASQGSIKSSVAKKAVVPDSSSLVPTMNAMDDIELLATIASLTLDDLKEVPRQRVNKPSISSVLSDEELAFQLYAQEARQLLSVTEDAIFARSINNALRTDRTLIRQLVAEETVALRDRRLALSMGAPRRAPDVQCDPSDLVVMETSPESSDTETEAEPKASVTSPKAPTGPTPPFKLQVKQSNECVICGDVIRRIEVQAPCGHFYDVPCLVDLFRATTRDESLFPPRCCQKPFILKQVRHYLGYQLASLYEKKSIEFSTVNRVYCSVPTCSAFIGATTRSSITLRCPECFSGTCGQCKDEAHPGVPCSTKEDAAVLALAEREGWKRCPGCHRLVELSIGCYHMTCRCRKEFCYVCTATWKTCPCPQWEERRLVAVAQDRVQRQLREEPAARAANWNFGVAVAAMADRLRDDHDCQHGIWRYRPGGGQCEVCFHNLPQYLLRCTGCQMLTCVRCRRNRL
ncbi:hypothetical protein K474DRAFT_1655575 [Panus rudis PR-1116 ss-1]|nr:hypothetical protein K474DRAFT_1655575 [Panus rudis PR-1116 ss-1]